MSGVKRVHSIAELAAYANAFPPGYRPIKEWLRIADTLRTMGNEARNVGNLEAAFLYYARSVHIILTKLPSHKQYHDLNLQQRTNLTANGKDIMASLEQLKPKLVDAFEKFKAQYPDEASKPSELEATYGRTINPVVPGRSQRKQSSVPTTSGPSQSGPSESYQSQSHSHSHHHTSGPGQERSAVGGPSYSSNNTGYGNSVSVRNETSPDELARRIQQSLRLDQREADRLQDIQRQQAAVERRPAVDNGPVSIPPHLSDALRPGSTSSIPSRTGAALAEARKAAGITIAPPAPAEDPAGSSSTSNRTAEDTRRLKELEEMRYNQARAVALAARRREESLRAMMPHRPKPPVQHDDHAMSDPLPHLPLQNPLLFQQQQQRESPTRDVAPPWTAGYNNNISGPSSYSQPKYAVPFVSTLPNIEYPRLMTPHQQAQGYIPTKTPGPQFSRSSSQVSLQSAGSSSRTQGLYNVSLPQRTQPMQTWSSATPQPQSQPQPQPQAQTQQQQPVYGNATRAGGGYYQPTSAPPIPPRRPNVESIYPQASNFPPVPSPYGIAGIPEVTRAPSPTHDSLGFQIIDCPADIMDSFLSVAQLNTSRKRETCGLLLGKSKGPEGVEAGFVIQTLLIPEQRGTEDSCTMENEEMVFQFQIGRELLTLGWIHTHPTQSCFMSSMDLHNHLGYQQTLKEAVAIVCSPAQEVKAGIFRLTAPDGINTIMRCQVAESFHPHYEPEIYTDVTHMRMIPSLPLEIVDLRLGYVSISSSEGTGRDM